MLSTNGFSLFVNFIFPPMIITLGIIGNLFGVLVLLNKNLLNIGPRDTYLYLFAVDNFYLLQIIGTNLQYAYDLNVTLISDFSCRFWNYINYSFATISPWLVVYISIDRYISIQHPSWRFKLRKRNVQLAYFIFTILTHLIYYLIVPFYYEIKAYGSLNQTIRICDFVDPHAVLMISYMDLAMRAIVPFFLMLIFSTLLSYSMFASRKRIVENFLAEENQTFYKEIRLATSSICLNLIYILFQLPISVTIFFPDYFSNITYLFTYYLFYVSYAVNFFIILPTNTLFRNSFFAFFSKL